MLHHQSGGPKQIEHDAHEGIDRDLGHDAAEQTGDMARRRGMGERQPSMERHETRLRAGADQNENENERRERCRGMALADRVEGVLPFRTRQQAEGEQQSERAEARHDEIDIARPHILAQLVVRHDQCPRGQRHEFPGEEEGEGVVGNRDEIHAGKKERIERQHALRRMLVLAVTERIEARRRAAEIDDDEEECRERVQAEMRAEPRQPNRKRQDFGRSLPEQLRERDDEARARDDQGGAVDDDPPGRAAMQEKRKR